MEGRFKRDFEELKHAGDNKYAASLHRNRIEDDSVIVTFHGFLYGITVNTRYPREAPVIEYWKRAQVGDEFESKTMHYFFNEKVETSGAAPIILKVYLNKQLVPGD